jgi:hypothetical protein
VARDKPEKSGGKTVFSERITGKTWAAINRRQEDEYPVDFSRLWWTPCREVVDAGLLRGWRRAEVKKEARLTEGWRTRREQKGDLSAAATRSTHRATALAQGLLAQCSRKLAGGETGETGGDGVDGPDGELGGRVGYLAAGRNIWGLQVPPARDSYLSVTPSKTGTAREWIQGSPGWCGSISGSLLRPKYLSSLS